jgi:hypothetical protein
MPYKNKEEANAAARRRWAEDPAVRERHKVAQDRWEEENQEERNVYRTKWAKDHRFKNYTDSRAYEFAREMKKYGTTVEWYLGRLIEQCGVCAICKHLSHHHGTIQRLQVDHNHDCCDTKAKSCGKCNRGLLCADCNIRLSYLEAILDETYMRMEAYDGTWLEKAIKYLDSYKGSA